MTPLAEAGFLVAPHVLTANDISAAREAIIETIDRAAHALRTPFEVSCPEASLDERLSRIAQRDHAYAFALFHAVMADAQLDPRIANLLDRDPLRQIVQRAVAPGTVTGRVVRTRAVIPSLTSRRHFWHQDVLHATDDGRGCGSVRIACWIPLSDVDGASGALEVIPGSWTPLLHRNDDGHFSIREENVPAAARSLVPLHAGDALLLDRFIPHRSSSVGPGRARWAVVAWIKATTHANC